MGHLKEDDVANLYEEHLTLEKRPLLAHSQIHKLTRDNSIVQTISMQSQTYIGNNTYLRGGYITEVSSHLFVCAIGSLVRT